MTTTIHPAASIIAAAGTMETDREILRQKRELAAEEGKDLLVRYYDRKIADLTRSIAGADALIAASPKVVAAAEALGIPAEEVAKIVAVASIPVRTV